MSEAAIVIVAPDGTHYTGPVCERCGIEPIVREVEAYGKKPQKARLGPACLAEWWPVRDRTVIFMKSAPRSPRPFDGPGDDLFAEMLRTMMRGQEKAANATMDEILRRLARQAERQARSAGRRKT